MATIISPANTKTKFVPVQTRSERMRSNDPADYAVPTGREVNWKFTPLAKIAPIIAERNESGVLTVDVEAPAAVSVVDSSEPSARGEFFIAEDLPSAIAVARTKQTLSITIPEGFQSDSVIEVQIVADSGVNDQYIVIDAKPFSSATVLLSHHGSGSLNQNVEILVRDEASLDLVTAQLWDDAAIHLSSHQAKVARNAKFRHNVVSLGGEVVRLNPSVDLAGTGSEAELFGVAFARSGQHLESQVFLYHHGANTTGDVLYKSALKGVGARNVWIGDVLIGPDASGTNSYEANRNLVLNDGARADSIPNLEIETGDIEGAGHASATGRFDDEQLFYLQARGIDASEAQRLVVFGFLNEIISKIGIPELESKVADFIEAELKKEGNA